MERIIAKLNLETCSNTIIGNSTNRGISGGQVGGGLHQRAAGGSGVHC